MRNRDVIAILIVVLLFVAGAVFLTETNHKKHNTDPAFPDNSLEFIQMDVETGRIRCAKNSEYVHTGHCEEWIINKRVKN